MLSKQSKFRQKSNSLGTKKRKESIFDDIRLPQKPPKYNPMNKLLLSSILILLSLSVFAQSDFLTNIKASLSLYDSIQQQEKVYLHTDRTLFQNNETIWFNAYIGNSQNAPSVYSRQIFVDLIGPVPLLSLDS